ncbi:MAG TPA: DUF3089 domain-containing protein [Acetobacteraceae bacterium]|nr:DUF3089 domain-containing protein [Acetobacteraceae bacterium]
MKLTFPRRMFAFLCAVTAAAPDARAKPANPPVEYGQQANWVCRPGDEGACTGRLDAIVVTADGTRTPRKFQPLADPPIDCFYIYPTVSPEPGPYSDLRLAPEIADAARTQVGRLRSRCRLFAPIYRQLTDPGLSAVLAAHRTPDWTGPYADVVAAWKWYLAHDNHGRGVVLIGHSQGTILLQRLLAEQIDGQKDQRLLVAAFLAGALSLPVAKNSTSGGAFKHIPLCTDQSQTGCVYVWSSYLADDTSSNRVFGHAPAAPLMAACASPASPGTGPGELKAFFPKPRSAPATDPPWIDVEGQLSARCVADAQGNVLRVTIEPSRFARWLRIAIRDGAGDDPGGWGLHALDLDLTQGNVLDRVAQETTTWLREHPAPAQ